MSLFVLGVGVSFLFTCDLVHLAEMAQTCLSLILRVSVLDTGIGALWRLVHCAVTPSGIALTCLLFTFFAHVFDSARCALWCDVVVGMQCCALSSAQSLRAGARVGLDMPFAHYLCLCASYSLCLLVCLFVHRRVLRVGMRRCPSSSAQ